MSEPLRYCLECGRAIYKQNKKFCTTNHQNRYNKRLRNVGRDAVYRQDEPLTKATTLLLVVMAVEAAVTIWIVTGAQGPV